MRRLGAVAIVLGVVGFAAARNPPPASAPTGDLGLLQGNWKPLSIEFEGKAEAAADHLAKITAVFDQAEYHLYWADKSVTPPKVLKLAVANVTLDPTTSPKTVVFEFARGPLQGQKRHGIYELAGNQLKFCLGPMDKPRPTSFASPVGSGYFLEVWARQAK